MAPGEDIKLSIKRQERWLRENCCAKESKLLYKWKHSHAPAKIHSPQSVGSRLWANQRPVSRSYDHSPPIRGQYWPHSECGIQAMSLHHGTRENILTNTLRGVRNKEILKKWGFWTATMTKRYKVSCLFLILIFLHGLQSFLKRIFGEHI